MIFRDQRVRSTFWQRCLELRGEILKVGNRRGPYSSARRSSRPGLYRGDDFDHGRILLHTSRKRTEVRAQHPPTRKVKPKMEGSSLELGPGCDVCQLLRVSGGDWSKVEKAVVKERMRYVAARRSAKYTFKFAFDVHHIPSASMEKVQRYRFV